MGGFQVKAMGSQTHPELLRSGDDAANWTSATGRRRQLHEVAESHLPGVSDLVSLCLEVKVKCHDSQ